MNLFHDSRNEKYRSPFGAAAVGSSVKLGFTVQECSPKSVYIRTWHNTEALITMSETEPGFFTGTIKLPDTPCLFWYYFVLEFENFTLCYGRPDKTKGIGAVMESPESWQITCYIPTVLPEWYRKSVVYQIFPDRFARGHDWQKNMQAAAHPDGWSGTSRIIMQNWDDLPFYCKDPKGRVTRWPFFGGSLQGIREKLPYLQSLGIGVIYLNPIFLASSNHKYDTANYMELDPGFGTEQDFIELCQSANAIGIHIILDGVFSHTGDDSIYFNRYDNFPEPGAFSAEPSPYDDWYRFGKYPTADWECWWGVDSLPNVEETNPTYQDYIAGEHGVIQKWLQLGASGWRLDVADELPDSFIEKIRAAEKAVRPDTLLLGEVWEDASNKSSYNQLRRYFLGTELDCTMHYPFRTGAIDYVLGHSSAQKLANDLTTILENYPSTAQAGALNLIGTHDTQRILTILGEAPDPLTVDFTDIEKEYYTLPVEQLEIGKLRLKMLQVLQFSVPGVPCVYYGDEAGAQGYADPWNRGTFPWGHEDLSLTYHIRMLSTLRKEYPVFTDGTTEFSALTDDVFCIKRTLNKTCLLVITNRTNHNVDLHVPDASGLWLELTGGKTLSGPNFHMYPYGYIMLLRTGDQYASLNCGNILKGAGVLLPLFSLPGEDTESPLNEPATRFLNTLSSIGASSWMLLPLNPAGLGNSPYSSRCLFAGDPRYIDHNTDINESLFSVWRAENADWLEDYAVYTILREKYKCEWQAWPTVERERQNLSDLKIAYQDSIEAIARDQYRFSVQWDWLHNKARELGISLIGDIPIYAALDSADTWAGRHLFALDENGMPTLRAGCPPDYFNADGQDWGNPLYKWNNMAHDGFSWWKRRIRRALKMYDYIRLDHFRAFSSYYAIPAKSSAKHGVWLKGPGLEFFREMKAEFGTLPIIAEDLGTLDSLVTLLLTETGLPGMNVWQFGPEELREMSAIDASKRIFFSGTHDNQTLAGFINSENLSLQTTDILSGLLHSPATAKIFPVQDLLGLDDTARINVPGVPSGNWTWRMTMEQLDQLNGVTLFHSYI